MKAVLIRHWRNALACSVLRAVKVSWLGLDGKQHQEEFDGLWATCAQHEIDHLDGVLFIDHISAMRRQMITRKMVKLKRERARDQA